MKKIAAYLDLVKEKNDELIKIDANEAPVSSITLTPHAQPLSFSRVAMVSPEIT